MALLLFRFVRKTTENHCHCEAEGRGNLRHRRIKFFYTHLHGKSWVYHVNGFVFCLTFQLEIATSGDALLAMTEEDST